MQTNGHISERQLMVLAFLYTIGTTVLIVPSGLAATAHQDAWLGALAGIVFGGAILGLYVALWRAFPGLTLVGICEAALGRWLGALVALLFVFGSFVGATTVLYYVGNFYNIHFIPHTPISFINALFAVVVVMGVRMGIEAISRTAELMLPWFLILFVVLLATLTPEVKPVNLQPVLEGGIGPVLRAGFSFAGTAYLPVIFLFAVLPRVRNPEKARIWFVSGAMIGGICVFLITLLCILILGPNITTRSMFPSYALVKKINIGNFLQRIEAFMAGLWFVTTYIKTTFYFYGWVAGFSEILRLRHYRAVTLPFGLLLVVFSVIVYPDVAYMQKWDTTVFLPYILTIGFLLPLLLLGIGLLRRAGSKSKGSL